MTKRRRIAIVAVPVLLVIALAVTVLSRDGARDTITASGTVEATEADLGFQIPGRIDAVVVREGDRVDSTADLAWLDRAELSARRSAAEAHVAVAQANLAEMQAGFRSEEVEQGRAALRAAEQRLANVRRDHERTRNLFDGGAVSRQVLEHQETALELAQAEYDAAREQLGLLESGPRRERIAAQRAALAQARAVLAEVEAAWRNATIRAPYSGLISVRHREPGEVVQPGAPVLTITNTDDRWVRIYVREDEVGRISLGQRATITADSYPEREYQGRVTFIASEAEFTPRNVQTTDERVKLVYRVKVQIVEDTSYDLKPGLAADVNLNTPSQ